MLDHQERETGNDSGLQAQVAVIRCRKGSEKKGEAGEQQGPEARIGQRTGPDFGFQQITDIEFEADREQHQRDTQVGDFL